MTEASLATPVGRPERPARTWWPHVRGSVFWNFWLRRIVLSRVVPIILVVFATGNAFGFSYWHWMKRLGRMTWAGVPMFTQEEMLRLSIFAGAVAIGIGFYLYVLLRRSCWSGIGWKGVLFRRLFPMALIAGAVLIPEYGYRDQALYWQEHLLRQWVWPWKLGYWQGLEVASFWLVGVAILITWGYVLLKAWQGIGSSWFRAILAGLAVVALAWVFKKAGAFPHSASGISTFAEILGGAALGVCFSLTLIDRFMSGTVGSTATIKENDAGMHEPGHEHDDQAHHGGDDDSALLHH
jgi:hypothetical protein